MNSLDIGFTTGMKRRRAALNLTPLIDVIFMLLLFFMLATSFDQWRRVDVAPATPSSAQQAQIVTNKKEVILRVDVNALTLANKPVALQALPSAIRELTPNPDSIDWVVLPGAGLKTQRLLDVLDGLRHAGVAQPALRLEQ